MVDQKPDHGEEKLEPGTLTTNSRVLKWLDNFWYHYKWHTIITLFVAVVVIVGVVVALGAGGGTAEDFEVFLFFPA